MALKYAVMTLLIVGFGVTVAAIGSGISTAEKSASISAEPHMPTSYRSTFEYLGSWAVAADAGTAGSKQMHQVYASPGSIAAFRKSGKWPDGTTLVKEIYNTDTGSMTTGTVSRAATLKGWFVMVKDSRTAHAASGHWGDGWGWAWFNADDQTKSTTVDYRKECLGCHTPAKDTDWIYVQGYPVLR